MGKILLYYKYVSIEDPQKLMKEQRTLCQNLGLKGRILIAAEGINGTVGGSEEAAEAYKRTMLADPRFADMDIKESDGDTDHFPRLRIAMRSEIVSLGLDPATIRAELGGAHLTPEETHELLNEQPEDLVILDARNDYESQIGTFRNSIKPPIKNFRDLPQYIDENLDTFKDRKVLMHCTGGIRCERASAYLKQKGITKEVYQIQGGIHRYMEKYPDGHFRGKLYVFDGRVAVKVNDDILSECYSCQKPYDEFTNCINVLCNKQVTLCSECNKALENTCSPACQLLVGKKEVGVRTKPKRPEEQKTANT